MPNQRMFEYSGSKLAAAASARLEHHQTRFKWWHAKKEEVMQKLKAEGLEVDENSALQQEIAPKARDWQRGAQVMIRIDLQNDLRDCLRKLAYHTEQANAYEGWVQVLQANPDARLCLDHEDWLLFFGKDQ
jgi:hypothetical protein